MVNLQHSRFWAAALTGDCGSPTIIMRVEFGGKTDAAVSSFLRSCFKSQNILWISACMPSRTPSMVSSNVDFDENIIMLRDLAETNSHHDEDSVERNDLGRENGGETLVTRSDTPDLDPNTSALTDPPVSEGATSSNPSSVDWRRRHFWMVIRPWWKEFVGCIIIILSVLATYQHKPQPDWPDRLSINTIVSVLVTILKISVISITAEG